MILWGADVVKCCGKAMQLVNTITDKKTGKWTKYYICLECGHTDYEEGELK